MMLIFAVSASAQFKPGIAAGYSLTIDRFDPHGFSPVVEFGVGHGFYVGPTFEYNVNEHFAIEASLLFTRESGTIRAIPFAFAEGVNDAYRNLQDQVYDVNGFPAQGRDYDDCFDKRDIQEVAATKIRGSISTYDLRVPFVTKLKYGKLGVFAGLYLDVHMFTKIHFNAIIDDGDGGRAKYTENSIEMRYAADQAYYQVFGIERMPATEYSADKLKTWDQVWDKGVASRVNFGGIAGVEIYFTDNVGMTVSYYHDILTNLKKSFKPAGRLYGSGVNFGLNYRF